MPDTAPTMTPARTRQMPEFGRGTCVGRYVVLERLGSGGMGVVYRAYDPDLDRRVALKLVRDLSEEASQRLVREAQALAKVAHPNIVAVHDVGTFAGSVFIAMELVEGRTLSQWARAERPGWREVVANLIEAGRGLAAAHAAGLIHRDFKPNNVIVGNDGRVRVLDFGLARVVTSASFDDDGPFAEPSRTPRGSGPSPSPTTELEIPAPLPAVDLDGTTEGDDGAGLPRVLASRVIGTPIYMAPEQRSRGIIDSRVDQFAFAVTAWELLYGERPFEGSDGATYVAAQRAHQVRPPPAGSDVPAWLRRVLVRALSPTPGDRFRAMDELLAALDADPAARRRRIGLGVAAAGLIALAVFGVSRQHAPDPCGDAERHLRGVWDDAGAARIGAAFAATQQGYAADTLARVRQALDDRAAAWASMHRDACLATKVRGEQSAALLDLRMGCLERRRDELRALVDELGAGPDVARLEHAIAAVARLPEVATCADRDGLTAVVPLPREPAERAAIDELRRELAAIEALLWTGQYAAGRTRAAAAVTAARATGWSPVIAEASYLRGQLERVAGDLAAAEAAQGDAVLEAARAHLDELAARAWAELVSVVGYEQARPVEGLALAQAAEAAIARVGAPAALTAGLRQAEALTLSIQGKNAAALVRAREALAIVEQDPDDPEIADILNTIAMLQSAEGDYPAAEATHRRALAIRVARFGAAHPRVADSTDNLGVVLFHQGRLEDARVAYQDALALRLAALGPTHRDVATSHNNLGGLLMELHDDAGATAHLEAALALYEGALGPTHPDLAIPLSNLGELASRRGDHAGALGYCERALDLDEAASGAEDPDLAYDLECLGEAQHGLGDAAAARATLERALRLRESAAGDAGELARTRFALAQALAPADHARAVTLATAARATFATLGDAWAARLAAVDAWLRSDD